MNELVPYQSKRHKQFPKGCSLEKAVEIELRKHLQRNFPDLLQKMDAVSELPYAQIEPEKKTLYTAEISHISHPVELALRVACITSPVMINDPKIPWTLHRLDIPLLLLSSLKKEVGAKNAIDLLPKPYQTMCKRVYSSSKVLEALAIDLHSQKRAKKYLRILQKRFGLYHQKKPGFKPL